MAPRHGGGGGGGEGAGGAGGGSSSCDNSANYPCSTQLHYIYGSRVASEFSEEEVYGQLILYGIWTVALGVLFWTALRSRGGRTLQLAIACYTISFIFLCVRFGLIVAESDVPFAYRYESSVVVLLQRLGTVFLFGGCFPPAEARKVAKLVFYPVLGVLAVLDVAYLVLDFLISAKAIDYYKDEWSWYLTDRDFGLTLTDQGIEELTMNGNTVLNPFYVESRVYDISSDNGWQQMRSSQIKVGVASEFVSLAMVLFLLAVALLPRLLRQKPTASKGKTTLLLLVAALGLLLTSLFRVVVATHLVLWNWGVLSDVKRWIDWTATFDFDSNRLLASGRGGFLDGYRTTVAGFPVVQALFEPLGVVLACLSMVLWWRNRLAAQAGQLLP